MDEQVKTESTDGMSMMDIMRMEADKLEAEESATEEETTEVEGQAAEEGEPAPAKEEAADPEPAVEADKKTDDVSEPSQADKDKELYDKIFAERAQAREKKKETKEAAPIAAGKKEELLSRVIAGDVVAMNELIDNMGQKKFDELIKHRLATLDAATEPVEQEATSGEIPAEYAKKIKELEEKTNAYEKHMQDQALMQTSMVEQQQLNLIKEAIDANPDEYELMRGQESQIRTFALQAMAAGQEITPQDAVRIMNNQWRTELLARKDAMLRLYGIDPAKGTETQQAEKKSTSKKAPISNSTETNNTPTERRDEDMPVDIDERLDWMMRKAREENILE